jgi:hypothetical protein
MNKKIPIKGNLTIRKREKGYLIMNRDTSGFHVISSDGYELLKLCNGKNKVEDIIENLSQKFKLGDKEKNKFKQDVISFLKDLEKRRIIKWK